MFEISQNKRVLFGSGSIAEVSNILTEISAKKVFILSYTQLLPASFLKALEHADTYICDIVQNEPDLAIIDRLAAMLVEQKSDVILAIGGGSVLDAAKAASMIATNGGTAEDYQMKGRVITMPSLPLIMIPTTAGTGSESTKTSVLRNGRIKKSIHSPHMMAETVILDPDLTIGLSQSLTASTGIDALSHAVESYVSLNANIYTRMYSLKAIEQIGKSIVAAVNDGKNLEARAGMLYASFFAGCALHAGIGLAHIIAQPIGGMFNVPHGEACSIFLPYSMEFNLETCPAAYCDIGRALGIKNDGNDVKTAKLAIQKINEIISVVKTPTSLKSYVKETATDKFLNETVAIVMQATGHIKCNPRPVSDSDIKQVLTMALS